MEVFHIMVKIRYGVFETNSSSSHSFIFRKYLPKDEKSYNENIESIQKAVNKKTHTFTIDGETCDFGWGFDILCTPREKLEYCLVAYHDSQDEDKTILDELRKVIDIKNIRWKKYKGDCCAYDHGYIDHQSYGLLQDFIKKYNISLVDFIFDSRYVIFIDNDNSDHCDINLLADHDNGSLIYNSDAVYYEEHGHDDEYYSRRWDRARESAEKCKKDRVFIFE